MISRSSPLSRKIYNHSRGLIAFPFPLSLLFSFFPPLFARCVAFSYTYIHTANRFLYYRDSTGRRRRRRAVKNRTNSHKLHPLIRYNFAAAERAQKRGREKNREREKPHSTHTHTVQDLHFCYRKINARELAKVVYIYIYPLLGKCAPWHFVVYQGPRKYPGNM